MISQFGQANSKRCSWKQIYPYDAFIIQYKKIWPSDQEMEELWPQTSKLFIEFRNADKKFTNLITIPNACRQKTKLTSLVTSDSGINK